MLDITGFLNRNFDSTISAKDGDELRVNCPNCDDDKHHLYVNVHKQICHCFKCDYSSNWVELVMLAMNCEYYIALGELYEKPRMVDFQKAFGNNQKLTKTVCLPDGFVNLLHSLSLTALFGRKYVWRRGFTNRHITYYNLGIADSVPYRIIIPIEGEYWQGRATHDWMEPKYINPQIDARSVIFNSQALDLYDEVVVCEGAFSAMAVGENAIALIGKHCTDEKFERLAKACVSRFILTVEPETNGEMEKLADKLSKSGKDVTMWYYNTGDPADNDGKIERKDWNFKSKVEAKLK